MPVIIKEEDEDEWLNPENKDFDEIYKLLAPYPEAMMKMHIVSKRVNSPRNDDKGLVEELRF